MVSKDAVLFVFGGWRFAIRGSRLAVRGWLFAVRNSQFAVGGSLFAVRGWKLLYYFQLEMTYLFMPKSLFFRILQNRKSDFANRKWYYMGCNKKTHLHSANHYDLSPITYKISAICRSIFGARKRCPKPVSYTLQRATNSAGP